MRDQNSQFDNSYYTYERGRQPLNNFNPSSNTNDRSITPKRGRSALTVLLCVVRSLAAGFAGATAALYIAAHYPVTWEETETTQNVLCEDPVQLDLMEYGYVRGVIDHGLTLFRSTESRSQQRLP